MALEQTLNLFDLQFLSQYSVAYNSNIKVLS